MTVAIRQIIIPRHHRLIHSGQAVNVMAQVIDSGLVDQLVDTDEPPIFTLFNPAGTRVVDFQPMERVQLGLYNKTYQTAVEDTVGNYTGSFQVKYGEAYARLEKIFLFKITKQTEFFAVNYLGIKDQSDAIWYWFLDSVGNLVVKDTIPNFLDLGGQPVGVTPATIPYWLQVDAVDAPATQLYMYPVEDTGEVFIDTAPPAVGTGYDVGAGLTLANTLGIDWLLAALTSLDIYTIEVGDD